jgi:hypothetical protein
MANIRYGSGPIGHEPLMARDELNTNRIPEVARCDDATIRRDVLSQVKPVVLRGLVDHWPAARYGRTSPRAILDYLCRLDNGSLVNAILIPPEGDGRLGYNAAMSGFNFARAGWRAAFEHYIFGPDALLHDHIPPERRGVLGEITPELAQHIPALLFQRIKA